MKKISPLLGAILLCTRLFSQAPAIDWQRSLGGAGLESGHGGCITSDQGYVVIGTTDSTDGQVTNTHGDKDIWVVKLDSSGTMQWQKALGGSGSENTGTSDCIQQTSDAGYILVGYSSSTDGDVTGNHGNSDCWVVKLNSAGNIQWQKSLGGTGTDYGISVRITADGGYIVAGTTYSNNGDVSGNHGGGDYWVVKLDGSGTIQWQKTMGGTNYDYANDIKLTSDGGYVVAGTSRSTNGNITNHKGGSDFWIVKLDSAGNTSWQNSLGGDSDEIAYSIQQTNEGGYIVAGISKSNNTGDVTGHHPWTLNAYIEDTWVVKLNSSGNLQWQRSFGGTAQDWGTCIRQTYDGGYIVVCLSASVDGDRNSAHHWGMYEFWILKLKPNGNIAWQKSLGGSGQSQLDYDVPFAIQQLPDSGYMVAGVSGSIDGDVSGNHGKFDFSVYRLYPAPPPCIQFTISNTGFYCDRFLDTTTITMLRGTADSVSWGDGISYKLYNLPLIHVYTQPGIYTINIFDSTGCYAMEFDTLINAGVRIDTTLYINPTCSFSVMGQISIVASGGTAPYSYLWNTGATTSSINNLTGGDYSVSVTDNTGCLSIMHYPLYKITDDYTYYVDFYLTSPNCINNGVITSSVHNGVPPFTYLWNNNQTTQSLTSVGQGYYAITVTDSLGCRTMGNLYVQTGCNNFIYGNVYDDANNNCTLDTSDIALRGVPVTATQGDSTYFGWVHSDGTYLVIVPDTGSYALSFNYNSYGVCSNPVCPAPPPVYFSTLGDTSRNNDLGVQFTGYDLHLCPGWGRVPPCAGFGHWQEWFWIPVYNTSPINAGPVTVTFKYDPILTPWEYVHPGPPTTVDQANHTLTWVINNGGTVGQIGYIEVKFNYILYNPTTLIESEFWVSPTANDCDISNNHSHFIEGVFASHDPNEKTVEPAGDITGEDTVLTYTIHFQNNGLDTAWFITIKDTLSLYVDPASVRTIASSLPVTDFNLSDNGILTWKFNPALLPDSLVNPETSKGFVIYQVKKKKNLPVGTVISNRAAIYFDYQEPVITNTVTNTIVNALSILPAKGIAGISVNAFPNPFSSETNIAVTGLNESYDFELYEVTGRTIKTFKAVNTKTLQLKREELAAGMYLYGISVKGKKVAFGKLVAE